MLEILSSFGFRRAVIIKLNWFDMGFLKVFSLGFCPYLWCWKRLTARKIINHQNLYLRGLIGFHFWFDWIQYGRFILDAQMRVDLFLRRTHDVINFLGYDLNYSWLLIFKNSIFYVTSSSSFKAYGIIARVVIVFFCWYSIKILIRFLVLEQQI